MKIQKASHKKKNIITAVIIGVFLVGAISFGLIATNHNSSSDDETTRNRSNSSNDSKKSTNEYDKSDADKKSDFLDNQKNDENSQNTDNSTSTTNAKIELSATTSSATVTVFTKLYTISDGTCILTLKKGTSQIERTAPVIYQPEYSTCEGFSIPTSELAPGAWEVSVSVKLQDQTVKESTSITINR